MIYSGQVFDMCKRQFERIADHLDMPWDERDRIFYPKRAITVSCPIHRDDGSVSVYQGYRVQHHLTLGPTKGGTRFAKNVDIGEVAALAVWMSWKCALAGLPYGGAKGGITVDPSGLSLRELEALSRRYMQEMIPFVGSHTDIMAPDMGTNEQVMAWFMDTYSMHQGHTVTEIVTGKPVASGGTEGRREATGLGALHLIKRACEYVNLPLSGSTAIIQGFGNVGGILAQLLDSSGVRVVELSDHTAAYYDRCGLDVERAVAHVGKHGVLAGLCNEATIDPDKLLVQKCDILVPAAVEQVIDETNAALLRCRIFSQRPPMDRQRPKLDSVLADRPDVFVIPDILCNAGGVIVSYFEWVQDRQQLFWGKSEVVNRLHEVMDRSFSEVLRRAERTRSSNRTAAIAIGVEKVRDAKRTRGLFP